MKNLIISLFMVTALGVYADNPDFELSAEKKAIIQQNVESMTYVELMSRQNSLQAEMNAIEEEASAGIGGTYSSKQK